MTTEQTTPRIWIGSLAAYGNGLLLGDWFDAIDAPTEPREWVDALIERRVDSFGIVPTEEVRDALAQRHEELWVFDHEGFEGLISGEGQPSTFRQAAVVLDAVIENGHEVAAFAAWVSDDEGRDLEDDDLIERFEDAYLGEHAGLVDYAREFVDSVGILNGAPEYLATYFDYEAYARDLRLSGDVWTADAGGGNVYVFSSY